MPQFFMEANIKQSDGEACCGNQLFIFRDKEFDSVNQ